MAWVSAGLWLIYLMLDVALLVRLLRLKTVKEWQYLVTAWKLACVVWIPLTSVIIGVTWLAETSKVEFHGHLVMGFAGLFYSLLLVLGHYWFPFFIPGVPEIVETQSLRGC